MVIRTSQNQKKKTVMCCDTFSIRFSCEMIDSGCRTAEDEEAAKAAGEKGGGALAGMIGCVSNTYSSLLSCSIREADRSSMVAVAVVLVGVRPSMVGDARREEAAEGARPLA